MQIFLKKILKVWIVQYVKFLIFNFFFYKKEEFANKPDWSIDLQSNSPNFGNAKIISLNELNTIIKRKKKSREQLKKKKIIYDNKICILILTCKRENSLLNLLNSIKKYFKKIDKFRDYEIILVDNGSDYKKTSKICLDFKINKHFYFKKNIGMSNALRKVYSEINNSYIMLLEDDFILKYNKPFIRNCINIFIEYKDIGIIRLKNQNNWGKPYRIISPLRKSKNIFFWTWVANEEMNVWCSGSVMFKKEYYDRIGGLPWSPNINRFQFYIYENLFAKKFNKYWNAAKIKNCYPFIQNNLNEPIK
jgi:hypothetical protein